MEKKKTTKAKKGVFSKLVAKLDSKMEQKAKKKSCCCCCGDDEECCK